MVIITLQRDKCIGCNYCVEMASNYFKMSKKDGKTVLLNSIDKKGFHTLKESNNLSYDDCNNAAKACPVKIISTRLV